MTKETYQAPEMEALGSFEELTQAAQIGNALDASYHTDTPIDDLTFS
jgi:hypothetical protein